MEFKAHSHKQELAIFSQRKIVVLATGIQFGKTQAGAIKTKIALHSFTDPGDNFIITSPTYKILTQSTLPPFLKVMAGCGEFNKADMTFKMHGGGTVYFRTATDPDSIVGITDVRFIWGDEAGLYGLYFWENIQARSSFRDCQVLLTTSPYTLNWLYKEIIRPKIKNHEARPDVELIMAASNENPFFPQVEFERKKSTMDPRRFRAIYGGQWEKMSGLVFDCFDEEENTSDPIKFPAGTRYFAGVDWGYTDPFVIVVHAITPSGVHYQVSEVYKPNLTITEVIGIAKQKKDTFGIERFYCDPSQPAHIDAFNKAGCPASPANNEIRMGLDKTYELIKARKLKIIKGTSPYTLDELEQYHYPEPGDIKPDQDGKDLKPVDQNNHAMDATRYVVMGTALGVEKRRPRYNDETQKTSQHKRLERLKRRGGSGFGPQTESWSA
jgi:PBSX family phage terminase large subunit